MERCRGGCRCHGACSGMLERCLGGCRCHGACSRMLEGVAEGVAVMVPVCGCWRGWVGRRYCLIAALDKSQDVGSPPVGRNVSNIVSKFSIKPLHSNSKIRWISRGLLFSGPSTTKMRAESGKCGRFVTWGLVLRFIPVEEKSSQSCTERCKALMLGVSGGGMMQLAATSQWMNPIWQCPCHWLAHLNQHSPGRVKGFKAGLNLKSIKNHPRTWQLLSTLLSNVQNPCDISLYGFVAQVSWVTAIPIPLQTNHDRLENCSCVMRTTDWLVAGKMQYVFYCLQSFWKAWYTLGLSWLGSWLFDWIKSFQGFTFLMLSPGPGATPTSGTVSQALTRWIALILMAMSL